MLSCNEQKMFENAGLSLEELNCTRCCLLQAVIVQSPLQCGIPRPQMVKLTAWFKLLTFWRKWYMLLCPEQMYTSPKRTFSREMVHSLD